jgi:PAS domain S-box-containing protein
MNSEEKFRNIFEGAIEGIKVADINTKKFKFVNPALCSMLGYTEEELLQMKTIEIHPQNDLEYVLSELGAQERGEKTLLSSIPCQRKDGTTIYVDMSIFYAMIDGIKCTVGFYTDVTDLEKIEDEMRDAKIAKFTAEESNRVKSEFLATMSHELRTPLNSIIGFSDLMICGSVGEMADKQKKFLDNISLSGKHLLSLINNILDLSKIEAGKMELDYERFDVYATIDEVKQLVSPLADKNGVKLEILKDESLEKIDADRVKFKQILFNLASNAIKFTPRRGEVTIIAVKVNDKVQFSVKDTGIGISEEDRNKLFQPFTQIESTINRRYEGTGLGLSLVKRMVELHGGSVWVESELGKGTTFTFELPLEPASNIGITNKMVTNSIKVSTESAVNVTGSMICVPQILEPPNSKGDEPLILVVEDDDHSRELLEVTLLHEGYRVASAKNGKEALELANEMNPFAITLDIMMPGMDGWDVLKHLKEKEQTNDIPVIITSMLDERELGIVWGAVEHFIKPIQKETLLNTLEKIKENMLRSSLSVLVVDDEISAVELIAAMLKDEKFDVLAAYGGQEAIDIAFQKHPDVIVLDLMMPVISGFDVIKALKANPDTIDTPIIICTAKDLDSDDKEALDENVVSIMHKGMFTKDQFIGLIKSIENRMSNKDQPNVCKEEACL